MLQSHQNMRATYFEIKISDEEAKLVFDKFGITDFTTPDKISDPVFEQPVSPITE